MRFDEDENLWLGAAVPGRHREIRQEDGKVPGVEPPAGTQRRSRQINQVSPDRPHVDGKVWLQDAGTYTVLRLDVESGKFEMFEPYKIPRPNVYDVIPDSRNNGYVLPLGSEEIGRIDAKTGVMTRYKTPTAGSGPRRGMMDSQGPPLVRREPRRSNRDVRHADRTLPGMAARRHLEPGPTM